LHRRVIERGQKVPSFIIKKMEKEEIRTLVEAFIRGTDQFLVDIKLSPSKLAVFLDKPTGITLEECAALNRHLSTELETTGFLEKHELEVSSPGMDMPLVVMQQYLRRIGKEIKVMLKDGKEAKGILQAAGENEFEMLAVTERKESKKKIRTEAVQKFAYSDVRETKLIFNFKLK
jgi:ribosome maturation factor RimP